jgi:hypothetical protein
MYLIENLLCNRRANAKMAGALNLPLFFSTSRKTHDHPGGVYSLLLISGDAAGFYDLIFIQYIDHGKSLYIV